MAVTRRQRRHPDNLLPLIGQYLKFGAVGLMATAVHVSTFAALIESVAMPPLQANLAAFCLAVCVSFVGNFHWTFQQDLGPDKSRRMMNTFIRFVVVAMTGLALNSLAVHLIMNVLGLAYGFAIVFMIAVVPVFIFALNKLWAFRSPAGTLREHAGSDQQT